MSGLRTRLAELVRWWPLGAVGAGLWLMMQSRAELDYGWHVQAGWYFLRHGIPATDVFTYTARQFPWIDHEWLSDIVMAGLDRLGGYAAVAGLYAAVWTAALALAIRGRQWPVLAIGLVGLVGEGLARPMAWSGLGLAVVMWWLERERRWLLLVPVLAVWANLHGGFVVGLLAMGATVVRRPRWWWLLVVAVLATWLNPYGPRLYVEIWRTLSDSRLHHLIGEWEPLRIGVLNGLYVAFYVLAVQLDGWRRWQVVLPTVLLATAVGTMRQFLLFVVASLGLVAMAYERLVAELSAHWRVAARWLPVGLWAVAAGAVGAFVQRPVTPLPVRAVADLRDRPCAGRVFNDYDLGGYLIWQLPGVAVYIDGRMPSWRLGGTDYLGNWMRVLNDERFAQAELARYDVGCAVLRPNRRRLIRQLQAAGWRETVREPGAVVLRRP